jgi:alkyl hydroperoxide reductase subunit AhpC
MPAYDADADKFAGYNAQVVGISVDSIFSHIAWQEKSVGKLKNPLCSDFYPHGEIAKRYGVLREGPPIPGINDRAIFIVDKQGKIVFSKLYDLGEQPENEEAFEVLKKL